MNKIMSNFRTVIHPKPLFYLIELAALALIISWAIEIYAKEIFRFM